MLRYNNIFIIVIVIALTAGCKKEEVPSAGNLIDNYSFEENGVFSTSGWIINNAEFSTLVPENGGDFSIKITPALFPAEGTADFIVLNLNGNKTLTAKCKMNVFGGWTGKVQLLQQIDPEVTNVIASFEGLDNTWQDVNLSANVTFEADDVLILRLSAGSSISPLPLQFVLFDLVELEIN